jgi:8-oxo-dGTP diphosphatase
METKNKKAVCAIIKNINGDIVSVSRKYNHELFGLVGGKVDAGETIYQAIVREIKEETGLIVDISDLELIDDQIYGTNRDTTYHQHCFYVHKTYRVNEIYDDETAKSKGEGLVRWVSKEFLSNGFFGDYNKKMLELSETKLV